MIGKTVGQYKLTEKLGEGGMGAVYKGVDLMIEREVAIKMLRPEIARDPDLVERFRTEAVTLAKLNSPGIATLYNFFREGSDFFMVMEFVSGQTLEERIRQSGALPWPQAVALFQRILECIQPAHNAGILHRDIKPANIMLTQWGTVKVMDFGIARVLGAARMTREGRMVGTIEYIAPERVIGQEADIRADIYSLGVVLYEMLSGRLPFQSTSEYEIMRGHVQDSPPTLASQNIHIPASLELVVMKALSKSTEGRIQCCAEFVVALEKAVREADATPGAGSATSSTPARGTVVPADYHDLKPTAFVDHPAVGLGATTQIDVPDLKATQHMDAPLMDAPLMVAPLMDAPTVAVPVFVPPPVAAVPPAATVPSAAVPPVTPPVASSPSPDKGGVGWKGYLAAAVVLIALAIGGFVWLRSGSDTAQTPVVPPPQTTAPSVPATQAEQKAAVPVPKKADTAKTGPESPNNPPGAGAVIEPPAPPTVPAAPETAQSANGGAPAAEQGGAKKPSSLSKFGKGIGRGIGKVLGKKDPKTETSK